MVVGAKGSMLKLGRGLTIVAMPWYMALARIETGLQKALELFEGYRIGLVLMKL